MARVRPGSRVRGRSGRWLSLHASPLSGGPHPASVAVTMNPAPATDVAEVLLLAYGLTPRERDVLARGVAGLPSRAIATELHITVATVQDHLKSVSRRPASAAAAHWWQTHGAAVQLMDLHGRTVSA
ncbi:LuxR C-terminal-related transcriptional regulator [Streptomyces sp. NPDC059455]|uniref:helix-turn-helix transcriptional regulator n=1 Tax=Streptomyces sp. NPDC059455 TaxID=3346837 RepID=UPI0036A44FAA